MISPFSVALLATLTFTMPTSHQDGSPLSDGYRLWQVSYGHQSFTWRDSSAAMLADAATWARLWPRVRAEAEPVVVVSGWAREGAVVAIPAPPVVSLYWDGLAYWVRSYTDTASAWSNPTRSFP